MQPTGTLTQSPASSKQGTDDFAVFFIKFFMLMDFPTLAGARPSPPSLASEPDA
jgi:hypothetical protein